MYIYIYIFVIYVKIMFFVFNSFDLFKWSLFVTAVREAAGVKLFQVPAVLGYDRDSDRVYTVSNDRPY